MTRPVDYFYADLTDRLITAMKADGTPNGKHADARARRYVMKAILKHLTIAWRAANRST